MRRTHTNRDDMAWLMREIDAGRTTLKAQASNFNRCAHNLAKHLRQFRKGVGRYAG